jgi:hypothetical protein
MPRHPIIDADSLHTLQHAIQTLARVRGLDCPLTDPDRPHDPGDVLHLLWSLVLQADDYIGEVIADAHDHGYTSAEIRALLDPPPPHPASTQTLHQRHQTRRTQSQTP